MAAAQSLLLQQQTHKLKPQLTLFHHPYSPHPPPQSPLSTFSSVNFKNIPTKRFKNLTVKYSFPITNNSANSRSSNGDSNHREIKKVGFGKIEIKRSPIEIAVETIKNALKKPTVAAVVLGLLLMYGRNFPLADHSGGHKNGGGPRLTSLSSSMPSSSRRNSLRNKPPYLINHSSPSINRSSSSINHSSSSSGGFLEFVHLLAVGVDMIGVVLAIILGIPALCIFIGIYMLCVKISEKRTSVLKLQVGLSGMDIISLEKELNRINASTSNGLHSKLTDTVLALLRYSDNFISAHLSIDVKWNMIEAEKIFCQQSFEERCKLDEKTLVNAINVKEESSTILRSSTLNNKHMVVTILVSARPKYMLPRIENSDDLVEALKKLGSVPISSIMAVEVIWTPQKEDNSL